MTKALTAAIEKRALMLKTGASAESIEVMNRRIAKLQPQGKTEQPQGSDKSKAQETEPEPNGFDAALASFTAAAHRNLCTRCQHTSRVLTEAGIEFEVAV